MDAKFISCAEFEKAYHPNGVLFKPDFRISYSSQKPIVYIFPSAYIVNHRFICGVIEQSINCEISANHILFLGPPSIVTNDQVAFIVARSKSGYFDDFMAEANMGKAEAP